MVSLSHLAAGFLLTAVSDDKCDALYHDVPDCVQCQTVQARSRAIHKSRSTVNSVYDSKARRYAEYNIGLTESNCTHL